MLENTRREFQNASKVCIFGCGMIGRGTAKFMNWAGIDIDFAVDNSSGKWGSTVFDGVKCCSPDVLDGRFTI